MEIKIVSQIVNDPNVLLDLITNSDNNFGVQYIVSNEKGTRAFSSLTAIVSTLSALGVGGVVVALINAVKDYKIKKLELNANEKENAEERKSKKEELIFSHKAEMRKLAEERKRIVLEGSIKIIGNYVDSILKEEKNDKRAILESLGFRFNEYTVVMPANIELNEKVICALNDALELKTIRKIVHIEQD